jgi:hypothetical protein
MAGSPLSPKILKGAVVLIDPVSSAIQQTIPLQYNPHTITRSLQVKGAGGKGDRSEALRLTGPPVETYKLEVEIDATDQLETGEATTLEHGIQPILAAFETIVYPHSSRLKANFILSMVGTIEILPLEAPLTLFVWSKNRVMPVRITDFSITEEAFDQRLNPIRAKINLGMRVLSIDDLGFISNGGNLYMAYQQSKEALATKFKSETSGISGI